MIAATRVEEMIAELRERLAMVEQAIPLLEALHGKTVRGNGTLTKRRGRKDMCESEREVVSQRMKKYWATRKGTMLDRAPTGMPAGSGGVEPPTSQAGPYER